MSFGMGADFDEPKSKDPTSAPSESVPGNVEPQKQKKRRNPRDPGPLARAIASSKRAYQGKKKYG